MKSFDDYLTENTVTLHHSEGKGYGHNRITIGKRPDGSHWIAAKFDNSDDHTKPSGHGSSQSLSNYTSQKGNEGSREAATRLHNALIDAHKTGDKGKVLAAMKQHGYSHHNWKVA